MFLLYIFFIFLAHDLTHSASTRKNNWQTKDYSECIREIGVGNYNLAELERFQQLPEDNPVLNKVLGCSWKKLGILGANSHINLDKLEIYITKLIPNFEEISENELVNARDIAVHCAEHSLEIGANTLGQRAVRIVNCINWYFEDMKLSQN